MSLVVSAEELSRRVELYDEAVALQQRYESEMRCHTCTASLQAVRSMRAHLAQAEARTREVEYMLDAALLLLKR